jgi:hypothetical protein
VLVIAKMLSHLLLSILATRPTAKDADHARVTTKAFAADKGPKLGRVKGSVGRVDVTRG